MTNIHRAIFLHLFWAWLLVSSVGGGLLFYLEIKRVDSSIIALAVNEADSFSSQTPSLTDQISLFDIEGWRNRALSIAQEYFVIITLYNRSGEQFTEVVNPRYADIEQTMRQHYHQFPLDGRRHFEKMSVDGKLTTPFSANTLSVPKSPFNYSIEIVDKSRTTYARNRVQVENAIERWTKGVSVGKSISKDDFPEPIV